MAAYGMRSGTEDLSGEVMEEQQEVEQEVELWSQQPVMSDGQAEVTDPMMLMDDAQSRASSKRSRGSAKSQM